MFCLQLRVKLYPCPRCPGRMLERPEIYGPVLVCVNCGHREDKKEA